MNHFVRTTALIAMLLVPAFAEPNKEQPKPETTPTPVVVRVAPPQQPAQLLNPKETRPVKLPAPPRDREYRSGWVGSEIKLPNF